MSDTGGGHRASAVAIDKAMQERIPGKVDVKIMDIWTDHATWPFHNFVPYYRFLAKYPLLWRGMYLYGAFPPTKLFTETWSWLACYKSFRKAIVDADPDLVVSVHPLCQLMPISIVKEMNKVRSPDRLPIPFVTVVTDLGGAHSTWFDRRADLCFVPSEAVRKVALKNRVPETKIVMHGLPIRPAFWKASKSKHVLRKALDLTQKVKTVLLMGGGDGVGGLEQIAVQMSNRLGESKKDSQVVVICGHNKRTSDNLKARKYPPNVRVVVRGFQKNIDEFMAACDVLVTKAGPGTYCTGHAPGWSLVPLSYSLLPLPRRCSCKKSLPPSHFLASCRHHRGGYDPRPSGGLVVVPPGARSRQRPVRGRRRVRRVLREQAEKDRQRGLESLQRRGAPGEDEHVGAQIVQARSDPPHRQGHRGHCGPENGRVAGLQEQHAMMHDTGTSTGGG